MYKSYISKHFVNLLRLHFLCGLHFKKNKVLLEPKSSVVVIAELLRGRRPREWSPIVILKGVLVIFYGHGKRNGSRARAPYIHTYIRDRAE